MSSQQINSSISNSQPLLDLWLAKVLTSGGLEPCVELKNAPDFIRSNENIVRSAIEKTTRNMEFASDSIKSNQNFIIECLIKNKDEESNTSNVAGILDYVAPELLDDSVFMLKLAKLGMRLNEFASENLMKDGNFVVSLIQAIPNNLGELSSVRKRIIPFKNHKEILTAFYNKSPTYFFYLKIETVLFTNQQYDEDEYSLNHKKDFHKDALRDIYKKHSERTVLGIPLYWQMTTEHHLKYLDKEDIIGYKEKVLKEYKKNSKTNLAFLLPSIDKVLLIKLKKKTQNNILTTRNRKQLAKRSSL